MRSLLPLPCNIFKPLHKCLTENDLPSVLRSSPPHECKAGRFPEGQAGVRKGTRTPTASIMAIYQISSGSTEEAKLLPVSAFFAGLCSKLTTQNRWLLPNRKCTALSHWNCKNQTTCAKEAPSSPGGPSAGRQVQTSSLLLCSSHSSSWWPGCLSRARGCRQAGRKGARGNPRNMKPNSKLYSLISFLIKKFKIEKTTKYKSFSDAFNYHRTQHL